MGKDLGKELDSWLVGGTPDHRAGILTKFVNDDYLLAIGRVITQWSLMETLIDGCIWKVAHLRNDHGRIFSAQVQVQTKLDILGALLSQYKKDILAQQFRPVSDFVRDYLVGPRNTAAHGMWSSFESGTFVVKFTARGQLTSQGKTPMPKEELEQLALDIASVTDWLMQLSELLPKSRLRPGGLGHKTPDTQNRPDCATRKQLALQPPTLDRKAWAARQPPPQPINHRKPKRGPKPSQKQKRLAAYAKRNGE